MKTLMIAASAAAALIAAEARASSVGYYVARDNTATLTVGGQAVPNPNHERLTLLYNHGDHFHSIGRFGSPTGRLPEGNRGPITLFEGTGAMAGRFVSQPYSSASDPAAEYSDLRFEPIHNLASAPDGSLDRVLYHSSGRRWSTLPLDGALLALELVSISSGLHARLGDGPAVASQAGDRLTLGAGSSFSSLLQFFTDTGVGPGTGLSATFRLVDLASVSPFGGSGDFQFVLTTVPEPSSIVLVGFGLGAAGVYALRRRRHRRLVLA